MDQTFDSLIDAIRPQPSVIGTITNWLLTKFASGIAIGCGIAVGLAVARAGGL